MEPHHATSIRNLVHAFEPDPSLVALLLTGSIAHGFATPESDIDVVFVIDSAEYRRRQRDREMHYLNRTLCTYPGYIDGKYADLEFLRLVATRGSDPARFAFKDSRVLLSRLPDLEALLADIVRFPIEQQRTRQERFVAQLLAWRWYYREATRLENRYLRMLALQKLVLFGCRIVLNENGLLYPYHKWLLRVVETARRKPDGFEAALGALVTEDTWMRVEDFCRDVLSFTGVDPAEADAHWPSRFMQDSELTWMADEAPIDDI